MFRASSFLLFGIAAVANASTTYTYQEIPVAQFISPPSWDTFDSGPPAISVPTGSGPVVSENGHYLILQGSAFWPFAGGPYPFSLMFTEPYQGQPVDLSQYIGYGAVSLVNDSGVLVYQSSTGLSLFNIGTLASTPLPPPPPPRSNYALSSLNDAGVLAGESFQGLAGNAWAFVNGRYRSFSPQFAGAASLGKCYGADQFAGATAEPNGSEIAWSVRNGVYTVLHGPASAPFAASYMQNHGGSVTGFYGAFSAMVWTPGKALSVLPPLVPGDSSFGFGLDDSNRVWGIEFGNSFYYVAWDTDGTPHNLTDYVPADVLNSAQAAFFNTNDLTGRIFGLMTNYTFTPDVPHVFALVPSG